MNCTQGCLTSTSSEHCSKQGNLDIKTESGRVLHSLQHLLLSKEHFKSTIEVDDDAKPAHISGGHPDKSQEENPTASVDRSTSGSYSSCPKGMVLHDS